jgi:hypothetical protein
MLNRSLLALVLCSAIGGVLLLPQLAKAPQLQTKAPARSLCQKGGQQFLVYGGGGAPSYNEIALEKNFLYFQRTLRVLGYDPAIVPTFFANGTNGKATVRYLNAQGEEKFKAPQIPFLKGASTPINLQRSLQQIGQASSAKSLFFYFTGHGSLNDDNPDNNALWMWGDDTVSVRQWTQMLDQLPTEMPVVTMMSQCFSGSFANMIYKGGDAKKGIALQTRCGFFATIKTNPSVGCTPQVNEADYQDYSSSFFAGLSGRNRLGKPVASADYNQDGRVSFAEAHAFAKVDEVSTDLPISTLEAWLQRQTNERQRIQLLAQPIATIVKTARPEQRYVIDQLARKFRFTPEKSFADNLKKLDKRMIASENDDAYVTRLATELTNVSLEQRVRNSKNTSAIATLDRLVKCESGSWSAAKP